MCPDSLGLTTTGLPMLRDLVHERLGLYYDGGRIDLMAERLAPLVLDRGFQSFIDFYYLLKYDEGADLEWPRVMDALSVQETYFWREIDQVRAVVDEVVPALAREHPGERIRIWSNPCATGEEPLTIAMALDQAGWFSRVPIEIHGSDASPAAIDRARAGRYRERSFRSLPAALRDRYFTRDGDTWLVDPSLHARVSSWTVVNLMAVEELARFAAVPIVFCRNVFIYFSEATVRHVVDALARLMPAPGYLCVGTSESLLKLTARFELDEIGGAFIYVKRT